MGSISSPDEKTCFVTLITRPSYLPGAIILAHSLDKHKSKYPLLVQYTSSLGDEGTQLLQEESKHGRILLQEVDLLLPRKDQENTASVADRFKDTFTKLRAFELYKLGYTRVVFLDADMAVFSNPDDIFNFQLPDRDWLGANHACVCNLDHDPWASADWHKGNCAYTPIQDPSGIAAEVTKSSRPTYHLLNSGMLLFYPSQDLWTKMLEFFNTTDKLKQYQFPDQDFMTDFFREKWRPMSWKYNAIKTMRYWHPQMWSDDQVAVLHYIVDKPWERKVSPNGVAGHLGRDAETHQWWWNLYDEWLQSRDQTDAGSTATKAMKKLVGQQAPFTEKKPLSQPPGKPEDVEPWP